MNPYNNVLTLMIYTVMFRRLPISNMYTIQKSMTITVHIFLITS